MEAKGPKKAELAVRGLEETKPAARGLEEAKLVVGRPEEPRRSGEPIAALSS